jgi:hypothetical protein
MSTLRAIKHRFRYFVTIAKKQPAPWPAIQVRYPKMGNEPHLLWRNAQDAVCVIWPVPLEWFGPTSWLINAICASEMRSLPASRPVRPTPFQPILIWQAEEHALGQPWLWHIGHMGVKDDQS